MCGEPRLKHRHYARRRPCSGRQDVPAAHARGDDFATAVAGHSVGITGAPTGPAAPGVGTATTSAPGQILCLAGRISRRASQAEVLGARAATPPPWAESPPGAGAHPAAGVQPAAAPHTPREPRYVEPPARQKRGAQPGAFTAPRAEGAPGRAACGTIPGRARGFRLARGERGLPPAEPSSRRKWQREARPRGQGRGAACLRQWSAPCLVKGGATGAQQGTAAGCLTTAAFSRGSRRLQGPAVQQARLKFTGSYNVQIGGGEGTGGRGAPPRGAVLATLPGVLVTDSCARVARQALSGCGAKLLRGRPPDGRRRGLSGAGKSFGRGPARGPRRRQGLCRYGIGGAGPPSAPAGRAAGGFPPRAW
jgi:hypothetical protein